NDLTDGALNASELVGQTEVALDRLQSALPNTEIFVQSVLPRHGDFYDEVVALNTELRTLTERKSLNYIDLFRLFVTEDGWLDPATSVDSLHLTGAGYERWRTAIDACVRDAC
ncbi:MAG: GDSL-type esterase/lipase family protein, partial [Pseudomonadota bacterium]